MLSRVADNLYWVSRYLERAEHTARVLDLNLNMLLEQRSDNTVQTQIARLLESLFAERMAENTSVYEMTPALAFERKNSSSITFCLAQARENARQIREQISSEMWEQLNTLFHRISRIKIDDVWETQTTHGFFREVYVSGYLFHRTDDRNHIAQDATHAWCEAYLPTLGWIVFDPTNNLVCADRHIRVAVGRDYADVPPTRGIFKGAAESELTVAVKVTTADTEVVEVKTSGILKTPNFQTTAQKTFDFDQQQQQQQ